LNGWLICVQYFPGEIDADEGIAECLSRSMS